MNIIKTYWIRDLRNDEELVLDAYNIKKVIEKTNIPKEKLVICRIYKCRKKEKSDLILNY